jgi:hypothetical protein
METQGMQSRTRFAILSHPRFPMLDSPWCWIPGNSKESKRLQIGSEYAFYWLAASISAVLYGTIAVKWYREASAERDDRLIRNAMAMGW